MHPLPQHTTSPACNQTPQCSLYLHAPASFHGPVCKDKTMLSSFIGPRQETTRTEFCNYLASQVEALEDIDFQTFRNESVKLLASRAGHRKGVVSTSNHSNLHFYRSSSATSTFVLQTFGKQPAPATREYIFTVPETQMPTCQVINQLSKTKWQLKDSSNPGGSKNISSSQPSLSLPSSQPTSSSRSRTTALAHNWSCSGPLLSNI